MDRDALEKLLKSVADGTVSPAEAEHLLRKAPYEDIGYAKIDLHRGIREGAAEVIYGAGKTAEQIAGIIKAMYGEGEKSILITRLDADKKAKTEEILGGSIPLHYYTDARIAIAGSIPEKTSKGTILVATGGTSDQPVAEEAAITAEFLGNHVMRLYDVGVSGLHRLLSHIDDILDARVIVVAAGMEGALASVVGGLADCPVIAVPTSVGYGASLGGLSALLSMLNSCASGVSVVNIDNGFGAGYQAAMINRIGERKPEDKDNGEKQ
ncbi:MAG: nickel pincer cofactor biosynthesis protein LarB [Lachnospiraceae bacterium]|nr:nickel pincer cofactor biosynthesis protein LarB [Lachnospiraceae bacterium]